MIKPFLITLFVLIFVTLAVGQSGAAADTTVTSTQTIVHPHSIGSSLWMIGNLFPDPAYYYQLSYGYQFTAKDNVIIRALTWTYSEPLGTYGDSKEFYPGKVRDWGVGLAYQRFHWKKLFTTFEATSMIHQFYDEDDRKIQKGYQLYVQFIAGYRLSLIHI